MNDVYVLMMVVIAEILIVLQLEVVNYDWAKLIFVDEEDDDDASDGSAE